ncbi:uncharacterized protein [Drosophila kikkawai]|uniref:Uncharacterized protein LOC108082377 n=1 Tax=Drosophila kikkawai TaxID=30033 RepID=A0A6P4IVX9_DROKI|nr:uncharacterized protein LOC108082377 [Drosophila kikkawai]
MDTRLLVALLLIGGSWAEDGDAEQRPDPLPVKRGRYIPELHGATAGWYVPDNSGKYRHEPRPYDGGYGDRGEPYSADLRGIFRNVQDQLEARVQEAGGDSLSLGPRDHLRFMIDFNFNGTGWQIIQFQWLRDGDESHPDTKRYSYVNENKLWGEESESDQGNQAYEYHEPGEECEASCQPESEAAEGGSQPESPVQAVEEPVQEAGEAQKTNIYSERDPAKIHNTINEVLEYIQQHILPKLS